jgi:5'-methylthioinosine phosphorylase
MQAVITGSGFEAANFGDSVAEHQPLSPLGDISSKILEFESATGPFFWLRRHGEQGAIAPHRINYRANIHALAELGVRQIIAVNMVGGISASCNPGFLAIPDQIIDLTWGRESSFYDGDYLPLKHIDFTNPFDEELSVKLRKGGTQLGIDVVSPATYVCSQGPRLETAAEIRAMATLGADIVGMTVMPEAALARELDIAYASVCPIVNAAAGMTEAKLDEREIRQNASRMMDSVIELIQQTLGS